jgi:hypothetical protein
MNERLGQGMVWIFFELWCLPNVMEHLLPFQSCLLFGFDRCFLFLLDDSCVVVIFVLLFVLILGQCSGAEVGQVYYWSALLIFDQASHQVIAHAPKFSISLARVTWK